MRAKETAEIVDKGSRLCCFHHRLSISPRSSSRAEPPSSGRAVRVAILVDTGRRSGFIAGEVKIQAELLYRRKRGSTSFPKARRTKREEGDNREPQPRKFSYGHFLVLPQMLRPDEQLR